MIGDPPETDDLDIDDSGSTLDILIGPEQAGKRLDKILAGQLPDISRARLQALIAEGALTHDGRPVTSSSAKVQAGVYRLLVPAPVAAEPEPEDLALEVLFEDAHLIVVNKPAGMAAHPAPGTRSGTLVNALLHHCAGSLSGIGGVSRPGIVHRLDKDTSGVMVAAKSDAAHAGLTDLFSRHDIERAYIALARGSIYPGQGTIINRISRSPHDRKKMAIIRANLGASAGREAITHYRTDQVFGPLRRRGLHG